MSISPYLQNKERIEERRLEVLNGKIALHETGGGAKRAARYELAVKVTKYVFLLLLAALPLLAHYTPRWAYLGAYPAGLIVLFGVPWAICAYKQVGLKEEYEMALLAKGVLTKGGNLPNSSYRAVYPLYAKEGRTPQRQAPTKGIPHCELEADAGLKVHKTIEIFTGEPSRSKAIKQIRSTRMHPFASSLFSLWPSSTKEPQKSASQIRDFNERFVSYTQILVSEYKRNQWLYSYATDQFKLEEMKLWENWWEEFGGSLAKISTPSSAEIRIEEDEQEQRPAPLKVIETSLGALQEIFAQITADCSNFSEKELSKWMKSFEAIETLFRKECLMAQRAREQIVKKLIKHLKSNEEEKTTFLQREDLPDAFEIHTIRTALQKPEEESVEEKSAMSAIKEAMAIPKHDTGPPPLHVQAKHLQAKDLAVEVLRSGEAKRSKFIGRGMKALSNMATVALLVVSIYFKSDMSAMLGCGAGFILLVPINLLINSWIANYRKREDQYCVVHTFRHNTKPAPLPGNNPEMARLQSQTDQLGLDGLELTLGRMLVNKGAVPFEPKLPKGVRKVLSKRGYPTLEETMKGGVESEIDCLRAQVKQIDREIAAGGDEIAKELLAALQLKQTGMMTRSETLSALRDDQTFMHKVIDARLLAHMEHILLLRQEVKDAEEENGEEYKRLQEVLREKKVKFKKWAKKGGVNKKTIQLEAIEAIKKRLPNEMEHLLHLEYQCSCADELYSQDTENEESRVEHGRLRELVSKSKAKLKRSLKVAKCSITFVDLKLKVLEKQKERAQAARSLADAEYERLRDLILKTEADLVDLKKRSYSQSELEKLEARKEMAIEARNQAESAKDEAKKKHAYLIEVVGSLSK